MSPDNKIFANSTYRELVLATAVHWGQGLTAFSRLLARERDTPNSDTIYRDFRRRLEEVEKDRQRLNLENFDTQNLNVVYRQELSEAIKSNKETKQLLMEANLQIESLEEAQKIEEAEHLRLENLHAEQLKELQTENIIAEEKIKELSAELHQTKEAETAANKLLAQHEASIKQLQLESQQLQTQLRTSHTFIQELKTRPLASEQRAQIIAEYRTSPELVQEIIEEFGKGYQAAMSKVEAAGIDPKTIDPSDDEDDDN